MKEIFILICTVFLFTSIVQAQNCVFYYNKTSANTIDFYMKSTTVPENVVYYDLTIYYDSNETSFVSFDVSDTNANLGWQTAGNTTFSDIPQLNVSVPIIHDKRVQIGVLDGRINNGNLVGSMISVPVKIATFVFDNSAGDPNSGGNIYIGAEDTDPGGILYYGFDFDPHPIVIEGSQTTLLPIELLSFTATKSGQKNALLEWATAVEKNAAHFELERNMEGSRLWEKAGQVVAVGESNTSQKYSFLDQNIPLHKTRKNIASYRLKMVDMDGSYKYSDIESVLFNSKVVIISTYPNPASDFINIKWHAASSTNEIATLEIFDLSGKLMLSKQITANATVQENIGDFPSGTYQLFVHHNRDMYSDQFVKGR